MKIDGKYYPAVPYTARNKTLQEIHCKVMKKCPSCGVKEGGYHHTGCMLEICPLCGKFWLSCHCFGRKVVLGEHDAEVISFPTEKRNH